VDWFDQNSLRYNHNAVYSPEWAALAKMPLVIKEHLAGFNFFKDFVQPTGFEMSNQYLMQKLQAQDQMKKIRLQDYMPELYSLLAA
jgi:hypothetical protein